VGVRSRLQRDQQDMHHLVRSSIRHQLYIHQDIMASREDPLSLRLDDQCLNNGLLTEDHNTNNNIDPNKNSLGMFNRTNQGFRLVDR
jgi:hypothetical protein